MFQKYVSLLKMLLINAKCCITQSAAADTSVHVSQTKQVAPQCLDGKIGNCDMIDYGRNTASLSALIHLRRQTHKDERLHQSNWTPRGVCVCVCVCVCGPTKWK